MAASSFRARRGPDALRDYVRKRLPLKVIEADQRRDRLILSEKAAAQQLRRPRREEALSQLEEAARLVMTGSEGLIHITETASRRIATLVEVVQPGDLSRVRVVAIDPERGGLSLSVRQAAGNVMYATRTEQDANV